MVHLKENQAKCLHQTHVTAKSLIPAWIWILRAYLDYCCMYLCYFWQHGLRAVLLNSAEIPGIEILGFYSLHTWCYFQIQQGADHFSSKCRLNSGGVVHQKQRMNNNKLYLVNMLPCFVLSINNWKPTTPSFLKRNSSDRTTHVHPTVPYIFIRSFYLVFKVSHSHSHNIAELHIMTTNTYTRYHSKPFWQITWEESHMGRLKLLMVDNWLQWTVIKKKKKSFNDWAVVKKNYL